MNTETGFDYKDYKMMKHGDYQSAGMFGNQVYAYEQLTGFSNMPEYRQITKKEFETFEEWSKEDVKDMGTLSEVRDRDILCSAHKGKTTIIESLKEVICPLCETTFLLSEDDIPDQEDLYIYCPNCNKPLDQKLIDESKKQLKNAGIKVGELVVQLKTSYINPAHKYDGRGYVEVGKDKYELKMQEHGKSSVVDVVTDPKKAAYFILMQLLPGIEEQNAANEKNEKKREKKVHKALEADFEKMDACYKEWFMESSKAK